MTLPHTAASCWMNRMLPKGGVGCVYRCISEVICSPTTHVHLPTTPPCRARADRPCRMAAWQVHQSTMSHGCPHVRADGTHQQQHPAPTATRSHSRSVGSPTRHPRACATHSACPSQHRYIATPEYIAPCARAVVGLVATIVHNGWQRMPVSILQMSHVRYPSSHPAGLPCN